MESNVSEQKRDLLKQMLRDSMQKPQVAAASCAQRRLWFINRLEEPNPSYNILCHFTLRGSLDVQVLERSINEVVRRHGVLRTTFQESGGEPQQVIVPDLELSVPIIDLTECNTGTEIQAGIRDAIIEEVETLFDLNQGPLLRAKLLRVSSEENVLILVMHHIISDGWSMSVLVPELLTTYQAIYDQQESPLQRLPLQYLDYSARQSRWLEGEESRKQLAYWTKRLDGLSTLKLPTDRPRPLIKAYKGCTHSFVLDPELSQGLRRLCDSEGVTLYMMMMTAYSILLHRYSGQKDIVFGSPIANRNQADIEGLIGFFVNVIIMRIDMTGDPSFRDLLKRVSCDALEAYANQDLPFEKLVEELRPDRDAGRSPLFQATFALHNEISAPDKAGDLKVSRPVIHGYDASEFGVHETVTRLDLELNLWQSPTGIRGTWAFDTELFNTETIARMTENFICLLKGLISNPNNKIYQLPILSPAERKQLLVDWNKTEADYPANKTVHELFESWVERTPDGLALEFEGQKLTYAQLNAKANRLARYLVRNAVVKESFVGVCLERGIDLITCILGIFKAGAVYLPLDPQYPESRLGFMLNDADVSVVLSRTELAGLFPDYQGNVVNIDAAWPDVEHENEQNLESRAETSSLAYVIYTSGSTGNPKGTLIEHRGLCKVSSEQIRNFDAGPGSRVLQFSSPNFDASLFDFTMALTTGGALILASKDDLQPGSPLVSALRDLSITILTIPPSSLGVLPPKPLPDLKVINVAGEACSAELVARWAPGRRFFNLYGPTEATIWTTANECTADGSAPHIGRPVANTKVYILDAHGQPVPIGVPGEMHIGGVGLARCYLNLPELNAEKFIPNLFAQEVHGRLYRTGDKVCYRPDGTLEFVGRIDHQVKVRGFRIELGEIEAVLSRQSGVDGAVVLAREDEQGDKRLVAYIASGESQPLTADGFRKVLQETLPTHLVPSVYVLLDKLPLTPNGKVDHKALPEPKAERQVDAEFAAPASDLESGIADIWKEALNIGDVGVNDNFFDLGGHSLLLVQVHEKLKKLVNHELPIVTLFQYPTVGTLAHFLEQQSKSEITDKPRRGEQTDKQGNAHRQRLAKLAQQQRLSRRDRGKA